MQCFSCFRIGHKAANCSSKKRCHKCGGDHAVDACTQPLHCLLCNGDHLVTDAACPVRSAAKLRRVPVEDRQQAPTKLVRLASFAEVVKGPSNRQPLIPTSQPQKGPFRGQHKVSNISHIQQKTPQNCRHMSTQTDFDETPSPSIPADFACQTDIPDAAPAVDLAPPKISHKAAELHLYQGMAHAMVRTTDITDGARLLSLGEKMSSYCSVLATLFNDLPGRLITLDRWRLEYLAWRAYNNYLRFNGQEAFQMQLPSCCTDLKTMCPNHQAPT